MKSFQDLGIKEDFQPQSGQAWGIATSPAMLSSFSLYQPAYSVLS